MTKCLSHTRQCLSTRLPGWAAISDRIPNMYDDHRSPTYRYFLGQGDGVGCPTIRLRTAGCIGPRSRVMDCYGPGFEDGRGFPPILAYTLITGD
jgi:hypothetical protein